MGAEDGSELKLNINFISEYPVTLGKVKEQAFNIASTYEIDSKFIKVVGYTLNEKEKIYD
jgi:hypothetical protein